MSEPERLAQLAERMGIESSYWDIFGTFHETNADSQRVLLGAMGCDVSSDKAIRHELHELDRQQWTRRLPPVRVMRTGAGPGFVDINLPDHVMARHARWKLMLESGDHLGGDFVPQELHRTGSMTVDGSDIVCLRLPFPDSIPQGYHLLSLEADDSEESCRLIVAPPAAYSPPWMIEGHRQWGWACHLYSLRSERNWGIGDFSDLGTLVSSAHGASVIGINPLHGLFQERPEDASPYSPSSRVFLNPLYIDVSAVEEFADCEAVRRLAGSPEVAADLAAARAASHVDYSLVTRLKMAALEKLYEHFSAGHPPSSTFDPRRRAFSRFLQDGGDALERFAQFEALREHFQGSTWKTWPAEYQRPDSPAVAAFARDQRDRIEFFAYLQWLADEQLGAAAGRCADSGMAVGLYRDLAVGLNPDGADLWCDQRVYAHGASTGAPPDAFNAGGQDWGLPPLHPFMLKQAGYEPFIRMVRANMRHAGGLRIDHAMAMQHLFWLVPGQDAVPGAYVSYPLDDLLGILALESVRNRCLVIGEDLGTVPEGFRERMASEAILSYRVLFFERHRKGLYRRPDLYPPQSVSIALTHDMPTLCGYWEGVDISQRREIGAIGDEDALRNDIADREKDKERLLAALNDQGLLPISDSGGQPEPDRRKLVEAVERFLARTPSCIMLANMDDATLEIDQLNMPGTVFEYPNWRRKLSMMLEQFSNDAFVTSLAQAIASERKKPVG